MSHGLDFCTATGFKIKKTRSAINKTARSTRETTDTRTFETQSTSPTVGARMRHASKLLSDCKSRHEQHTQKKNYWQTPTPTRTAPTWVHSANLAVSQPPRGRSRANHSIVINQPVCEIHDRIINYAGGSHGLQCVMCPVSSFRARETLDLLVG